MENLSLRWNDVFLSIDGGNLDGSFGNGVTSTHHA